MPQGDDAQYLYYNNNLQPFAHKLRNEMTKAEACLWKFVLRAGTMRGYTFRRQRPVLSYIVDFMCKELKLIIEVDGITHHDETARIKDDLRQGELESFGLIVMRFNDSEILNNIDSVYQTIDAWIEEYEKDHGLNPPPNPRQRGTRDSYPPQRGGKGEDHSR